MNEADRRDYGPVDKVPFTVDHLLAHLQIEAVLRGLLQRAHDEIERLNDENEALRIDLAAAYCRMDAPTIDDVNLDPKVEIREFLTQRYGQWYADRFAPADMEGLNDE